MKVKKSAKKDKNHIKYNIYLDIIKEFLEYKQSAELDEYFFSQIGMYS